jgi:hypothetical protein
MPFDNGIDFRYEPLFVTDPAGTTYYSAYDPAYPVTRGGLTFGWVTLFAGQMRDRSTSIDPRLAGIHYLTDTTAAKKKLRVDLPSSGAVDIYCALGDAGGSNNAYLEVFDDTTSLGVLVTDQGAFPNFLDATNVARSAAAWPGSNLKATKTFSTTTAFFAITPAASNLGKNYVIAHLRVVQSGGGGTAYTLSAAPASYALSMQPATLRVTRKLQASAGSMALTTYPTTLRASRKLIPTTASYNVAGVDVAIRATRKLQASAAAFNLAGIPVNLSRGYVLRAASGAYVNTAYAAVLRATRRLVCGTGAFHMTPRDASLVYSAAPPPSAVNGFFPWLRRRRR